MRLLPWPDGCHGRSGYRQLGHVHQRRCSPRPVYGARMIALQRKLPAGAVGLSMIS